MTLPGAEIRLYAGKLGEVAAPHGSDWPMTLMDIRADTGATLSLDVPAGDRGFVHLIEGQARGWAVATPLSAPAKWPGSSRRATRASTSSP